jgi:hypothetical protein
MKLAQKCLLGENALNNMIWSPVKQATSANLANLLDWINRKSFNYLVLAGQAHSVDIALTIVGVEFQVTAQAGLKSKNQSHERSLLGEQI